MLSWGMLIQSLMKEEVGREKPTTMRILQREVQIYREDNENIMKSREEILHSLNML
jgi:hypothetical protein